MSSTHTPQHYYRPDDKGLVDVVAGQPAPLLAQFVHRQFRALIIEADFPCVGARAAFRAKSYRCGVYDEIGSPSVTAQLADHLRHFTSYRRQLEGVFNTFIAVFRGPLPTDEVHFERLLWAQLQALHEYDLDEWDPAVSADHDDPQFEFSFAGHGFFVVGLHAASSRWSRRFGWPTLVFNGHDQFQGLRATGKMERFQRTIRSRDTALQGYANPNLADFGTKSDARQYSGRRVDESWTCAFKCRLRASGGINV